MSLTPAQLFCTVADLVADKQAPGVDEARMFQAIKEASDWVQKTIGWFIPIRLTRACEGHGSTRLAIAPTLLAVLTITNDGVTLSTADYALKPDDGYWPNGPYGELYVAPEAPGLTRWSCTREGVVITGHYGMYFRSGALDATVQDATEQTDSQKTLLVSDGSAVSPGMVLLIDSEQEAVTGWDEPTEQVTAINMTNGLSPSDEVVIVDDASDIHIGEIVRFEFEQCKVKDKRTSTKQLSLIRGWNGTGRVLHADDTPMDVYRTVTVERGMNGTDAAAHVKDTDIARYFVPNDILLLTKEIATLSVQKALSGYQGRTGNNETGVVFYNDLFPKFDIEAIRKNYYIPRVG